MYIKDLVEVLQTNLTTTKKQYTYSWYYIQIALFYHCKTAGLIGSLVGNQHRLWYDTLVSCG